MNPHNYTCKPLSDHVERSDLAKRFFIARWERERNKRERRAGALIPLSETQHDLIG
jgi:hypothetical protein